jgi:hypothetical protein
MIVCLAAVVGAGFLAGVAYAADQLLYGADNALLKADALVQASESGLTAGSSKCF